MVKTKQYNLEEYWKCILFGISISILKLIFYFHSKINWLNFVKNKKTHKETEIESERDTEKERDSEKDRKRE